VTRTTRAALYLAAAVTAAGSAARAEDAGGGGEVVDRVVAVVGSAGERGGEARIVTAFELEVEARLVLAERARSVASAATRELSDRLLESILETIVNHLLIEAEAERLELVSLDDEELRAERRAIDGRLGGEGGLERLRQALGAPADLVDAIVRRRVLVAAFLRGNVQLSVVVTDEEVEAAYRSGDHPFGNRGLEAVRPALEALITARQQRENLTRWLGEARSRTRVRLLGL
jgi:hypothetical protein